jgi:hypothetical protein
MEIVIGRGPEFAALNSVRITVAILDLRPIHISPKSHQQGKRYVSTDNKVPLFLPPKIAVV